MSRAIAIILTLYLWQRLDSESTTEWSIHFIN